MTARRRAIGWGIGSACVVVALVSWAWPFTIDDAYIPCRYAANLAEGHGLVWNRGERSAGVTGLAWTLLLALARAAGIRDLPLVAKSAGLAFMLFVVAWVVARTRQSVGGRRGALAVALGLASSLSLVVYAIAGLETAAFTLAVTAAGVFPARGQWGRAGLAAGLACAVRPEGALVFAVVVASAAFGGGGARAALRAFAAGVLPALAAVTASWVAFGTLIPDTLAARRAAAGAGAEYLARALVPTGALLLWPLAVAAGILSRTRRTALALVAALVTSVGVLGGDWMPGWRFLVPVWPLTVWLAVRGALWLRVRARRRFGAALPALALAAAFGLASTTMAVALPDVRAAGLEQVRTAPRLVRALARLHAEHVALVDVGYVGWATRLRTTDLAGLTDRTIANARGTYLDKQVDEAYMLARRPDALVLHVDGPLGDGPRWRGMFPVERRVASFPTFAAQYRLVETVERSDRYRYLVLVRQLAGAHADE